MNYDITHTRKKNNFITDILIIDITLYAVPSPVLGLSFMIFPDFLMCSLQFSLDDLFLLSHFSFNLLIFNQI